jgi:hypothetical protein
MSCGIFAPCTPVDADGQSFVMEAIRYLKHRLDYNKVAKAKQSRYTPWWRWGERKYSSYSFLTSALVGGEWSASRPGRALPRGKDHRYPLYRRLGGSQSRSGHRGCRGSNLDLPVVQSVVRHYTD